MVVGVFVFREGDAVFVGKAVALAGGDDDTCYQLLSGGIKQTDSKGLGIVRIP